MQYKYSMNATLLAQRWLPLMEKAVNFYVHMQYYNATDGTYNLPTTFSPEYDYCLGNNTVCAGRGSLARQMCGWGYRVLLCRFCRRITTWHCTAGA